MERRAQKMAKRQLLSLVVPVFNEAEIINVFYERTRQVLAGLASLSY
jgi:polyisoprenyl-phosphate glycosyltransferase